MQLKRSKGLNLFDLDKSVSDALNTTLRYQLSADGAFPVEVRLNSFSKYVFVVSMDSCMPRLTR